MVASSQQHENVPTSKPQQVTYQYTSVSGTAPRRVTAGVSTRAGAAAMAAISNAATATAQQQRQQQVRRVMLLAILYARSNLRSILQVEYTIVDEQGNTIGRISEQEYRQQHQHQQDNIEEDEEDDEFEE